MWNLFSGNTKGNDKQHVALWHLHFVWLHFCLRSLHILFVKKAFSSVWWKVTKVTSIVIVLVESELLEWVLSAWKKLPRKHASSITPRKHASSITPRKHASSITPRKHASSITKDHDWMGTICLEELPKELIEKSFLSCALSANLDGSQDESIACIKYRPCQDLLQRLKNYVWVTTR